LGGGGGASRSGIKNKLRLYHVVDDKTIDLIDELELEKDEDAPMSMAAHPESKQLICGINSAPDKLEKGQNENCRVYGVQDKKLTLVRTRGTLTISADNDDYQKVTVLSPDAKFLAVAGNRDLSLLTYPSLTPAVSSIQTTHDIYDATFSPATLVIATTHNLLIYALPSLDSSTSTPIKGKGKNKKKGKQKSKSQSEPELELLQTIELPALPGGAEGASFRAARFHPHTPTTLYTILNTTPPRTRKTKTTTRPAFVVKWSVSAPADITDVDDEKDKESVWEVGKVRKVGEKGVTCFDVSPDGRFLAVGSSDYTIGILDANTLGPLLTILKAHEFPPTTLRFNPTSSLLISGSADNSVRVISVPAELGGQSWGTLLVIILTLIVIMLAIAFQMLR
jgi:prolactin regulatory element-binding protein